MAWILINGWKPPPCNLGLQGIHVRTYDGARNESNVFVGELVGRTMMKFDSMTWNSLTPAQWSQIQQIFEAGAFSLTYYDSVIGSTVTREFYPGDTNETPIDIDDNTGIPKAYINCKVSLIDTGA